MSYLVANRIERFSHDEAHIKAVKSFFLKFTGRVLLIDFDSYLKGSW